MYQICHMICLTKRSLDLTKIRRLFTTGGTVWRAQQGPNVSGFKGVFKAFGMWISRVLQIRLVLQEDAEVKAIGGKMAAWRHRVWSRHSVSGECRPLCCTFLANF